MNRRLEGKTALVIGAGSVGPGWGNGKATAVLFAREGANVLCVDVNETAAHETAEIIRSERGQAEPLHADATKEVDVTRTVETCLDRYGRIDILDNNVGIAEVGGVVELSEEAWDRVRDQSEDLLSRHEACDSCHGAAGGRLDHQYLVHRIHPLHWRTLRRLLRH